MAPVVGLYDFGPIYLIYWHRKTQRILRF